jgi:hypothetical protein
LGVGPQVANPSPDAEPDLSIAIVVLRWVLRSRLVTCGGLYAAALKGAGPPEPHGCPLTKAPLRNNVIL